MVLWRLVSSGISQEELRVVPNYTVDASGEESSRIAR